MDTTKAKFPLWGRLLSTLIAAAFIVTGMAGCTAPRAGVPETSETGLAQGGTGDMTSDVGVMLKKASAAGKIGTFGYGNEYELQALLTKYGLPTTLVLQSFDMNDFDDDTIILASAMTYNELGLVQNSYEGGYSYGDTVKWIDMNSERVAMLEDALFCTREFASANPNTVRAFIYATVRGWEYACANPDEAAAITMKYGAVTSPEHQKYMAGEVAKLVDAENVPVGAFDDLAFKQTLELAKQYIKPTDGIAADRLLSLTLDDIRDTQYLSDANASPDGRFAVEKKDVKFQLKWLPQAQFMGFFVAQDNGWYGEAGLNVEFIAGGGDMSEVGIVNSGEADFGVTWVSTIISADAMDMNLIDIAQLYQKSGQVLVYKTQYSDTP